MLSSLMLIDWLSSFYTKMAFFNEEFNFAEGCCSAQ